MTDPAESQASSTPSPPGKTAFRAYQPGDELGILDLWRRVFGRERSLEHWKWRFAENPYAPPLASLALAESGEVVGQYAFQPVRINLEGKPQPAALGVDTMVRTDYERLGLVFFRLAEDGHRVAEEHGLTVLYGRPHPKNYVLHVLRLGWKRILWLKQYSYRLTPSRRPQRSIPGAGAARALVASIIGGWTRAKLELERRRLQPSFPAARFVCSNTVPEGYDALWNEVRWEEVLSIWKDAAYLTWRYDRHPDFDFTYHYLVAHDRILALAVVGDFATDNATICELIVRGRDVALGRLLVNRMMAHLTKERYSRVHFYGHDPGFFAEVFAGFKAATSFALSVCARVLGSSEIEERFLLPSSWTWTHGDFDGF